MLAEREAEGKVETVIDTLGNVQAFYCSILWLKGDYKCSPRHEALQLRIRKQ